MQTARTTGLKTSASAQSPARSSLRDLETRDYGDCPVHGRFLQAIHRGGAAYHYAYRCPVCAREERERALWGRSGIPQRFRSKTLADYRATCPGQKQALASAHAFADQIEASLAQGRTMILCGNPGTGKTHIACAIGGECISAGKTAIFTSLAEIIDRVFSTWRSRSSSSGAAGDPLEALATVDLLIIDEIGGAGGSDAEKRLMFQLLNRRYEDVRSTILISNLRPDALAKTLGERTVDRFRETGEMIPFTWHSYRAMARELAELPDDTQVAQRGQVNA